MMRTVMVKGMMKTTVVMLKRMRRVGCDGGG